MVTRFEAAAQLAAYAGNCEFASKADPNIYNQAYQLAGLVAVRDNAILSPTDALAQAKSMSQKSSHPFEAWTPSDTAIERRVVLQEQFAQRFETVAKRLQSPLWHNQRFAKRHLPGNGRSMTGYLVRNADGGQSTVRTVREPLSPVWCASMVENLLTRLQPLAGLPCVEQLQGIRYTGEAATSYMPGTPYARLGVRGLRKIHDSHLRGALSTITAITDRAVQIDYVGNGHNPFNPKQGFSFFDPLTNKKANTWLRDLNVRGFYRMLSGYSPNGEKIAKGRGVTTEREKIAERYKIIVAETLPDIGPI
jgi:hypothetical protein